MKSVSINSSDSEYTPSVKKTVSDDSSNDDFETKKKEKGKKELKDEDDVSYCSL